MDAPDARAAYVVPATHPILLESFVHVSEQLDTTQGIFLITADGSCYYKDSQDFEDCDPIDEDPTKLAHFVPDKERPLLLPTAEKPLISLDEYDLGSFVAVGRIPVEPHDAAGNYFLPRRVYLSNGARHIIYHGLRELFLMAFDGARVSVALRDAAHLFRDVCFLPKAQFIVYVPSFSPRSVVFAKISEGPDCDSINGVKDGRRPLAIRGVRYLAILVNLPPLPFDADLVAPVSSVTGLPTIVVAGGGRLSLVRVSFKHEDVSRASEGVLEEPGFYYWMEQSFCQQTATKKFFSKAREHAAKGRAGAPPAPAQLTTVENDPVPGILQQRTQLMLPYFPSAIERLLSVDSTPPLLGLPEGVSVVDFCFSAPDGLHGVFLFHRDAGGAAARRDEPFPTLHGGGYFVGVYRSVELLTTPLITAAAPPARPREPYWLMALHGSQHLRRSADYPQLLSVMQNLRREKRGDGTGLACLEYTHTPTAPQPCGQFWELPSKPLVEHAPGRYISFQVGEPFGVCPQHDPIWGKAANGTFCLTLRGEGNAHERVEIFPASDLLAFEERGAWQSGGASFRPCDCPRVANVARSSRCWISADAAKLYRLRSELSYRVHTPDVPGALTTNRAKESYFDALHPDLSGAAASLKELPYPLLPASMPPEFLRVLLTTAIEVMLREKKQSEADIIRLFERYFIRAPYVDGRLPRAHPLSLAAAALQHHGQRAFYGPDLIWRQALRDKSVPEGCSETSAMCHQHPGDYVQETFSMLSLKTTNAHALFSLLRCDNCQTPLLHPLFCGRCCEAAYCSVECQLEAWPRHRKACRVTPDGLKHKFK